MRTFGERYNPAMAITEQAKADEYFEELVAEQMKSGRVTRSAAETVERHNLGYYAGYFTPETQERVERLFKCKHPGFGAFAGKRA